MRGSWRQRKRGEFAEGARIRGAIGRRVIRFFFAFSFCDWLLHPERPHRVCSVGSTSTSAPAFAANFERVLRTSLIKEPPSSSTPPWIVEYCHRILLDEQDCIPHPSPINLPPPYNTSYPFYGIGTHDLFRYRLFYGLEENRHPI